MWDGVTYVDNDHSPIISEGKFTTKLLVTNAGPSSVAVRCWDVPRPDSMEKPDIQIQLWPGNTSFVAGSLVRATITDGPRLGPAKAFAALGWRIIP
jgi:hypothetical protein